MSGLKGRPRKSDEEKKARGTYKPSRGSGNESTDIMIIDAGEPIFDISAQAKELWDAVVKCMQAYGTLTDVDIPIISMLAVEYDTYIKTIGYSDIELGADNCTKPSGYRKVRTEAMSNIVKLYTQLGVGAVVRHKIRAADGKPKEKDPMDDFM